MGNFFTSSQIFNGEGLDKTMIRKGGTEWKKKFQ